MSKKLFLISSLLAASSLASPHLQDEIRPLWISWKTFHDKLYTIAEEAARFAIFIENYKKIVSFNAENNGVKLALNKFGDMTSEEFKAMHTGGYKHSPKHEGFLSASHVDYGVLSLPDSVDWRQKGAITNVKNQGSCGSCWAFSTTGALEALHFINTGKLVSFSEQQIVDCDIYSEDEGCNGGLPVLAFEYTADKGIEAEADYPYTARDGKCKYDASKAIKVNSGSQSVPAKNVDAFKAALVTQPIAIGIQADQAIFQFYKSGVIKGLKCGDDLDHAVLAVGYDTIDGEEAFIVKNSWGTSWGDNGYVYISTNSKVNSGNGVCGILADPVVPTA